MAYQQHNDDHYNIINQYSAQPHYTSPSPQTGAHAYSTDDMYSHGGPGGYQQAPSTAYGSEYHSQSDWDSKSTKSYNTYHSGYADSQTHLNAGHEMSQIAPPLPSMPYQNYPPGNQLRPPLSSNASAYSGYSSAREKLMKRRSVRQVELIQGNLVLDVPVPTHIVPKAAGGSEEMSQMRYTAATCDPECVFRFFPRRKKG